MVEFKIEKNFLAMHSKKEGRTLKEGLDYLDDLQPFHCSVDPITEETFYRYPLLHWNSIKSTKLALYVLLIQRRV